jgi:hypothetical protein
MAVRFTPCPSCTRHVKVGDGVCPFCGASTPRAQAAAMPRGRLSRAALLAAGAAGALAMTDCGSSGGTATTPDGSPPLADSGTPTDDDSGTPEASATAQPFYGAISPPLPDAESPTDGGSKDLDATAPSDAAEGSTPDSEAGDEGGHMVQPLYGSVAPAYGATPH